MKLHVVATGVQSKFEISWPPSLKFPFKAPLHPWEYLSQPWSHIHVDYGGPVEGKMLFILVDAYSVD